MNINKTIAVGNDVIKARKISRVLLCTAPTVNKSGVTGHTMAPPLGLMSIIGYIRGILPDVEFFLKDFEASLSTEYDVERALKEIQPDIIGIQARSPVLPMAVKLAEQAKTLFPDILTILGGHHASTSANGDFPDIFDCVVPSEGENALVDLITWAREGVKWPRKHRGKPLAEYDYMPAWDLADQKIYRTPDSAFPVSSMGSTLWSRGCAFECVFCSGPGVWKDLKPRVKYRPVNRVVDELELLSTKYNIKRIYIHDDTLNTNVDILGRICDEIIRRKVKIQWFGCGLRADKSLTPQWIFEKMKQAGCWGISFGVESGDQYVLDKIKKRVPLEDVTRALSLAKGAGLRTAAGFTVGHVWLDNNGKLTGETPENLDKTVSFVKKLIDENLIYSIWVAIITPFPGSELWEYVKNSRVDMYDEFGETYLKNGRVRVMFKHPILSDDQIADYYTKIFHMVGFNFKHAIRRLLAVREWGDLRGIILGGIFVLKRTIPHAIKKFMHAKDK